MATAASVIAGLLPALGIARVLYDDPSSGWVTSDGASEGVPPRVRLAKFWVQ